MRIIALIGEERVNRKILVHMKFWGIRSHGRRCPSPSRKIFSTLF